MSKNSLNWHHTKKGGEWSSRSAAEGAVTEHRKYVKNAVGKPTAQGLLVGILERGQEENVKWSHPPLSHCTGKEQDEF